MIYDYVFVIFTNLYRLKHKNRNPLPAVVFGHNNGIQEKAGLQVVNNSTGINTCLKRLKS